MIKRSNSRRIVDVCLATIAEVAFLIGSTVPNAMAKTTAEQKIASRVAHMTTKQKVGQLFVTGVSNDASATKHAIKQYDLGGIILMGNNFVGSRSSFKNRLKGYQRSAKIPLTIATDQEGGTVSRLSSNSAISGHSAYLSPRQAYAKGGMKQVLKEYKSEAKTLHTLGINWNYALMQMFLKEPAALFIRARFPNLMRRQPSILKTLCPRFNSTMLPQP